MHHLQNPLDNNTYLISTNARSFGFIISDTDTGDSKTTSKSENFFEIFHFTPDITSKIIAGLNSSASYPIFAQDINSNGFLFCKPTSVAGVFAFVKRIDINPDEVATIIRESLINKVICIGGDHRDYSEESYAKIYNTVLKFNSLLSLDKIRNPKIHDITMSATSISDNLLIDKTSLDIYEGNSDDEYVFSPCGFALFLSFVYLSSAKLNSKETVKIELKNNRGCFAVCASIKASLDSQSNILPKLSFLSNIMDLQNLNLFYSKKGEEINMIFLPYYIDDGLHGVKAPIEFKKIL